MIVTNGINVLENITRMISEAKDEIDHNIMETFCTVPCTSQNLFIHISAYFCFDHLPHDFE